MDEPKPFVLRIDRPETLLLRVRAETLRINLQRAHEKLKALPNLSSELSEVRGVLGTIGDRATQGLTMLAKSRVDRTPLDTKAFRAQEDVLEDVRSALDMALSKLSDIERKSFLVRAQSIGQTVWKSLEVRAARVKATVENIDLEKAGAWNIYVRAESEANSKVFNESVELLGGIALRDARLGAEICELADDTIKSTFRTLPSVVHAIPGGIATMMMELGSIIRLRFPEWTIWALPLTAHEVWHAALDKEVTERLTIAIPTHNSAVPLENSDIQLCLADAFGTYMMGPAYAFAAVLLLFDPLCPRDEARVCAIFEMLTIMRPAPEDDYAKVAGALRAAWDAAKRQAAAPTDAATVGTVAAQASDANTAVLLHSDASPPPSAEDARRMARLLWETLSKVIKLPAFGLDEWSQKSGCCEALLFQWSKEEFSSLDVTYLDIRHALNAAWCVRVHPSRPRDKENAHIDLTEAAMVLAQVTKDTKPAR